MLKKYIRKVTDSKGQIGYKKIVWLQYLYLLRDSQVFNVDLHKQTYLFNGWVNNKYTYQRVSTSKKDDKKFMY